MVVLCLCEFSLDHIHFRLKYPSSAGIVGKFTSSRLWKNSPSMFLASDILNSLSTARWEDTQKSRCYIPQLNVEGGVKLMPDNCVWNHICDKYGAKRTYLHCMYLQRGHKRKNDVKQVVGKGTWCGKVISCISKPHTLVLKLKLTLNVLFPLASFSFLSSSTCASTTS